MLITNTFTHTFINNHPSLFIRHTKKDSCISSFNFHLRRKTLRSRLSTFVSPPSIIMSPCQNVPMSLFPPSLNFHLRRKTLRPYSLSLVSQLSSLVSQLSSILSPQLSCPYVKMSPCPYFPISHPSSSAQNIAPLLSSLNSQLSSLISHPSFQINLLPNL